LATRLYFHTPSSPVSNLPTTNQSTLTPTSGKAVDAFTVNRTMDRTKGINDVGMNITMNSSTSLQTCYFTRFISEPLEMSSIAADTWTYNFAAWEASLNTNFPCSGTSKAIYILCYVWRPGVGKIGTILEGDSHLNFEEPSTVSTIKAISGTFSGSAVTCQSGDVIIFEAWFKVTQSVAAAPSIQFRYDGINETTVDNTTVTDHASFIESTQDLVFVGDLIVATSDYRDLKKPITVTRV
jgi:hypothetical protein